MNHSTDIEALRLRFLNAWDDLTPVIVPGADEPHDEPETAYVVLRVMPDNEARMTLGRVPEYEATGLVWIDVYSPLEDNDLAAWSLADRAATIFRDWRSDDYRITCGTASMRNGIDEGKFMRLIVNVTYRARH